jgi:uncharacterized protein (TIGR00725 family)
MDGDVKGGRRATVAVVGDSALDPGSEEARFAHEVGRTLIDRGYVLVSGGRGGVMEAACRGGRESPAWMPGSIVAILPGHDAALANPYVDVAIPTGLDVARNAVVAHADAVVAVGGGAGTLSEIALAWQIRRLVVAFRGRGWAGRLADRRVDDRVRLPGVPDDRVYGVDQAAEAVDLIERLLPAYGSAWTGIGED